MKLDELIKMSNDYGANSNYVLAGGGNTSVKSESKLYVKCSGAQLATMTSDEIVEMDRQKLNQILQKQYSTDDIVREREYLVDIMSAITDSNKKKRPSVEALLHNLFSYRYVLHIHPTLINGLTCSKDGKEAAKRLFGKDVLWIPSCKPGYILAQYCYEQMSEFKKKYGYTVKIMLLQNHGIFISADTVEEINDLFKNIEAALKKEVKKEPREEEIKDEKKEKTAEFLTGIMERKVIPVYMKEAGEYMKNTETVQPLLSPYTPDYIVYCGPYPLYLEDMNDVKETMRNFERENGMLPKIILVEGDGVYIMENNLDKAVRVKMLFEDAVKIVVYAESFGGAKPMSEELIQFIVHWEAESYRSSKI